MLKRLKFSEIEDYDPINNIEEDKIYNLIDSLLENGWEGCPILVHDGRLLTGSHRLIALKNIKITNPDSSVLEEYVALDVTSIVNQRINELSDDFFEYDIDYSNLGPLLEGTEIEKYRDQIKEW